MKEQLEIIKQCTTQIEDYRRSIELLSKNILTEELKIEEALREIDYALRNSVITLNKE